MFDVEDDCRMDEQPGTYGNCKADKVIRIFEYARNLQHNIQHCDHRHSIPWCFNVFQVEEDVFTNTGSCNSWVVFGLKSISRDTKFPRTIPTLRGQPSIARSCNSAGQS